MTSNEVDPRVAATGGYRRNPRDPKSNYEWPGMMSRPHWQQTGAHQHTRFYGCAKCGVRFSSPQAVYTHLAKLHPAARSGLGGAHVSPSGVPTGGNGQIGSKSRLFEEPITP